MNNMKLENLWLIVLIILSILIALVFSMFISRLLKKPGQYNFQQLLGVKKLSRSQSERSRLKRIFDFVFAIQFMFFFSPVFLLFTLIVRLTTRGPSIVRIPAIGQYGKPIFIYQFRTVKRVDSGEGTGSKIQKVTNFGRFLLTTKFDKIPMIVNVLLGHISLVGRSRMYFFQDALKSLDKPIKELLLSIKPSIVSLKTIADLDEHEAELEAFRWDIYYAQYHDFSLDFKILLKGYLKLLLEASEYQTDKPDPNLINKNNVLHNRK